MHYRGGSLILPHGVLRWSPKSTDDAKESERQHLPEGRNNPGILPSLIVHVSGLEVQLPRENKVLNAW